MIPLPWGLLAKLIEWYREWRAEKNMRALYRELCSEQQRNPARLLFSPTSDGDFALYERMVTKGLMARDLPGTFHLVGR